MAACVTVHSIQPSDLAFLFEVYAGTRLDELAVTEVEAFPIAVSRARSLLAYRVDAHEGFHPGCCLSIVPVPPED